MQNFGNGWGGPQFLPWAGGLLDQPQWFLEDYGKISLRQWIREKEKAPTEAPLTGVARTDD